MMRDEEKKTFCLNCKMWTEIPDGDVGNCEYCGNEIFPCGYCEEECSYDEGYYRCMNYQHSERFKRNMKEIGVQKYTY